jgi:hypothetical protein
MAIRSHFTYLASDEAAKPLGVWGWAKKLIDALNRWKLFNLMDVPIGDKPLQMVRINAAGTDFEYASEELGLAGAVLTGLANQIIRVKATEDGYVIDKEVLHTLIGVALVGLAGRIIRVNPTEDGFIYDMEVMESLRGVSLAGKAGQFVKVNPAETGFVIAP